MPLRNGMIDCHILRARVSMNYYPRYLPKAHHRSIVSHALHLLSSLPGGSTIPLYRFGRQLKISLLAPVFSSPFEISPEDQKGQSNIERISTALPRCSCRSRLSSIFRRSPEMSVRPFSMKLYE